MMNLYMYSEFSKEISNISLKDGCYPCIGDQVSDQLEPALWFKVLILDAVSIDCNKRVVLWHTSTDLQSLKPEEHPLGEFADQSTSSGPPLDDEDTILETDVTGESSRTFTNSEDDHLSGQGYDGEPVDNAGQHVQRRNSRRVVHRRISESVYAGGECMGYSGDMDEVFEFTQGILSKMAAGQISQIQFNKEVFRLLHIYVLPNIQLSADDVFNVQDALAIVDSYVDDINDLIMLKQSLIDSVHRDMKKQRQKFVHEMCEADFNITSFSFPLGDLLLRQLTEDLSKAHEQLEDLTQKIEAAKEDIINSGEFQASSEGSSSGEDELSRVRSERDQFVKEDFNNLLTARAVLEEYTSNYRATCNQERQSTRGSRAVSSSSKKIKNKSEKERKKSKKKNSKCYSAEDEANPLHATYMGMEQTCTDLLPDILALADRKVLLLSVKETIRGVLEVLLSGKETSGMDIDRTGTRRPTDVLRHSQIPIEWLSLPQQVSSILDDDKLPLTQLHMDFCETVCEKCISALNERKLSMISNSILRHSTPPTLSPTENGGIYAQNKLYSMRHTGTSDRSSGISSNMSETNSSRTSNLSRSGTYDPRLTGSSCVTSSYVMSMSSNSSCELPSLNQDTVPQCPKKSASAASIRLDDSYNQEHASPYISHTSSITSSKLEDSLDGSLDVTGVEDEPKQEVDELEQTLLWIKDNVNVSFEDICGKLQQRLAGEGQTHFRKIWQCYETHFYQETLEVISKVYEAMYCAKIRHVLHNLPFLTAKDLDLTGFILNVLEDVEIGADFTTAPPVRDSTMSQVTVESATPSGTICASTSSDTTVTSSDGSGHQSSDDSVTVDQIELAGDSDMCMAQPICECDNELSSQQTDSIQCCEDSKGKLINDSQDQALRHSLAKPEDSVFDGSEVASECGLENSNEVNKTDKEIISAKDTESQTQDFLKSAMVDANDNLPKCTMPIDHVDIDDNRDEIDQNVSDESQGVLAIRPSSIFKENTSKNTLEIEKSPPSSCSSLLSSSCSSRSATLSSNDGLESSSNISSSEHSITGKDGEEHIALEMKRSFVTISQPLPTTLTWNRPTLQPTRYQGAPNVPLSPMALSRVKSTQFKPEHRELFQDAFDMLEQALHDASPLFKLQSLYKCLRELSKRYEEIQRMFCGKSAKPCTDDLIDILGLFLCNFDTDKAQTLYAHIMMLSDLMPRFFAGGQFSFTLVQFFAAFQILKERNLMKTAKIQNDTLVYGM